MLYKTKYQTLTFLVLVLDNKINKYFLNRYIDINDGKDNILLSLGEERTYYLSYYDLRKKAKALKVLFNNNVYWINKEEITTIK
jgi:hypothetical protein